MEEWRVVKEFPTRFMVSNQGRVWSIASKKILKQGTTKTGYRVISSRVGGRNGKPICKKVHRWVAQEFVSNMENKPYVNHLDGDKTNNCASNLEWCTSSENTLHAYKTGLYPKERKTIGVDHKDSVLNENDVKYIRQVYIKGCKSFGARALAKAYGVNKSTISNIVGLKTWKHVS